MAALAWLLLAAPAWAQLNFNSGPSTVSMGPYIYYFTPSGGTGPYTFAYAPAATQIPGLRVINQAEFPYNASASARGALVGLPVAPGTTYNTTIRMTDTATAAFVDKAFTLNVNVLNLIGYIPNNQGVGETVTSQFWGVGGTPPYTFSVSSGSLPTGLTLNPTTGMVTGPPLTTAGNFNYNIRVQDSAPTPNSATFNFGTTVRVLWLSNVPNRILPNGYVNQSYSQALNMTGGSGVYNFALVSSDSLPAGIELSTNGVISGTSPNQTFNYRFSVVVTDTTTPTPNTTTVRLCLSILPQTPVPLSIASSDLPDTGLGNHDDSDIYATGGLPPYTFSVASGSSLPPETALAPCSYSHLNWDPMCALLKRRQQTTGDYSFVVQVTDSASNVATRPIRWGIRPLMMYDKYFPTGSGPVPVLLLPFTQNMLPLGGTPPYTVSRIRYPYDLTISNAGVISGTVLENGRYLRIIYTLRDSAGNSSNDNGHFDVQSTGTPVALTLSGGNNLRYLQKGNGFAMNLTAGGSLLATPGYNVSEVPGQCNLPPGLKLLKGNDFNNSAVLENMAQIAGTPSAAGDYGCLLEVTDAAGNRGRTNYLFHVSGLAFVTTGFAPAYVGQFFTQTIDVRGGSPPYTYNLGSTLPTGLNFNPATGTISGTPSTVASFSVSVEVRSGSDMLSRGFTLNVYPFGITNPHVLPIATVGQNYSVTFTTTGGTGPFTWTASGLPGWAVLDPATGVLSGKPTGAGVSVPTITVGNGLLTMSKTFTIFIKNLTTAKILQGLPTPRFGDFLVGSSVNSVPNVNGGVPPYTITQVGGTMPPGLAIVPTNTVSGSSNFGRYSIAGIPTAAGMYSPRLRYQDSVGLTVERTVLINITPLNVATTNLQPAIVNQSYSAQLQGVGGPGPYTFALADIVLNLMPPGLTISPTGLISGIPTSTGSQSFTLDMTSGAYTRRLTATVAVNATFNRRLDFSFGPYSGDWSIGHGASISFIPSGGAGTHTWTLLTPLPPGMSFYSGAILPDYSNLSPPAALLAGAPTTPGSYTVKIRVDDSTGNFAIREARFVVTAIRAGPQNRPFDGGRTILPAKAGVPYSFTTTGVNARTPISFTVLGGGYLPAGLSFSGTGALSGTTADAGNYNQTVLLTDANGQTQLIGVSPSVYPAGQPIGVNALNSQRLPSATTGAIYSFDLNQLILPSYGTAPFAWAFSPGGDTPPGLNIVGNMLTGTPTVTEDYTFDLIVTDANLQQHVVTNTVMLVCPGAVIPAPGSVLLPATLGVPYSQTFPAAGGVPPYTFRRAYNSSMPVGMNLSAAGVLSGTPTTLGKFVLQFELTDSLANGWMPLRYILDVTGTPSAAITLAPTSINATYTLGSASPPSPVPVNVGSTGTAFPYTAAVSGGSWVSVAPLSGTSGSAVTVSFNPAGLLAGAYNGTLTITSAGASNSPATIPVALTVVPAAICSYALSATTGTAAAGGAALSFNVATAPSCTWTASSPDAWITIQSPGSGTGNGAVNFNAAAHLSLTPRTGAVVVQGLTYTLTQFGTDCAITVSPAASSVPVGGGSGQATVNASASICPWSASTGDGWITITAGSGTGSGSLQFTVTANALPGSRPGTITTSGQVHAVNQAGAGCNYSLSSPGTAISSAGGPASVNMTVPAGCTWTTDTGPSWITLAAPPPSGNGNGTVNLNIAPNSTTVTRNATVLIGGQSFQVTQGGVPCNFTLSSDTAMLAAGAGGGNVNVNASVAGCSWVAASNSSWLTLGPTSGSGNGTIAFSATANPAQTARSATLTVAGQNLVINQAGLTCSYTLRSASGTSPSGGGPTSVGVITAPGCVWSAASNAGFLTISSGASYSGPADVLFNVDANGSGVGRSGTLTVAGQSYSLVQAAAPCSIILGSSSFSAGEFGAASLFNYTTSVSNCPHAVQSYTSWITIDPATTYSGTNGTVNFLVAANTFAAPRSGVIKVGDMVFTVNQAASTCAYTLTYFAPFAPAGPFGRMGGDGAIPMTFAPPACAPPPVWINGPPGMITLGTVLAGPGTYTQNYTVGIYQSFINYTRAAEILVNGQIFKVKQNSW